jgi:hypothetical protein
MMIATISNIGCISIAPSAHNRAKPDAMVFDMHILLAPITSYTRLYPYVYLAIKRRFDEWHMTPTV